MRLDNCTNAPAIFQCADFDTADRYAVVIWKLTYDLPLAPTPARAEPWVLSADPMPITGDPLETAYGMFHGDIFLRKSGVDLCVLGRLRRARPIARTSVTLRCGSFTHTLCVTGDRVWEQTPRGNLAASKPLPFTEMDISYARAFGGVADYQGMPAPYVDNPAGRGYYLDRSEALGKPLPNIEAERTPVHNWDDRPAPAGWGPYPMHWGLRARAAVSVDPEQLVVSSVSPAAFNNAHPELVQRAIAPGSRIELLGVYDHPIAFSLPRTTGTVNVRVGDERFDVPTVIDGVYIWLDARRLVITQRANFHYVLRPEQVRVATLTAQQT